VLQGLRLNFHLVSNKDKKHDLHMVPNVNPICGWVLPNHLDRGLSIYDPQGVLLGEVHMTGRLEDIPRADWESAPNNPNQGYEYLKDKYPELYFFVNGIITAGGKALRDLIQTIDEILWVKNQTGQMFDQSLTVMTGRPLALVRSKLSLELDGRPILHPLSDPRQEPEYLKKQFQIGLGNLYIPQKDGLIGYYLGDNYGNFIQSM
jgi:hypothetical protein